MDNVVEKLKNFLGIRDSDEIKVNVVNQVTSINVEKIQSLIKQISNVLESPLIFIRMNSDFNDGEEISGRVVCMNQDFLPLKCDVEFIDDGNLILRGKTDELGSFEFKFQAEHLKYEIKVKDKDIEKKLMLNLSKRLEDHACYVVTDRDHYMPGQRIFVRFIL